MSGGAIESWFQSQSVVVVYLLQSLTLLWYSTREYLKENSQLRYGPKIKPKMMLFYLVKRFSPVIFFGSQAGEESTKEPSQNCRKSVQIVHSASVMNSQSFLYEWLQIEYFLKMFTNESLISGFGKKEMNEKTWVLLTRRECM